MRVLTPWITEPPIRVGWYNASTERNPETRRWWNGEYWSGPAYVGDPVKHADRARGTVGETQVGVEWRGQRLDERDDDELEQLANDYAPDDDANSGMTTPLTSEGAQESALVAIRALQLCEFRMKRFVAQGDADQAQHAA